MHVCMEHSHACIHVQCHFYFSIYLFILQMLSKSFRTISKNTWCGCNPRHLLALILSVVLFLLFVRLKSECVGLLSFGKESDLTYRRFTQRFHYWFDLNIVIHWSITSVDIDFRLRRILLRLFPFTNLKPLNQWIACYDYAVILTLSIGEAKKKMIVFLGFISKTIYIKRRIMSGSGWFNIIHCLISSCSSITADIDFLQFYRLWFLTVRCQSERIDSTRLNSDDRWD